MKYAHITFGRVEAVWNKLGGEAGVRKFLAGELELVERKLAYLKNQHGHIVITLTGSALSGEAELERLTHSGFDVCDRARWCLKSDWADGYDKKHRLVEGKVYQTILIPGEMVGAKTMTEIQSYALRLGYQKPKAGIIPRLREVIPNKMLEALGLWHITAVHEPITDFDGDHNLLRVLRFHDKASVDAICTEPNVARAKDGAFAFLVPES